MKIIPYIFLFLLPLVSFGQTKPTPAENRWVDSVFNALTPDERIAQLYMIPAYSNKGIKHETELLNTVKTLRPGGLIFFQGTPGKQASLTNMYQKASKTPMLIAGDFEWGLAMRLDSVPKYPWQMTLGALRDERTVTELAALMAKEFKRIGVNVSFSPVLDINNNPKNPIIGLRSFGDTREAVVRFGIAFTKGLQDNGVLACGKHFPGHGDTDKDSHKTLPVIPFSRSRLDSLELFPFKALSKAGIGSIMVGHLFVPELDNTPNLPSSLSSKIITDILRKEFAFEGLIFTDAMNMKGLSANYPKGVADVKALKAGVDILLMPGDMALGIQMIKEALLSGELNQADLDEKCKRVLRAKYRVGLYNYKPVSMKNIHSDLFTAESEWMNRKIAEKSITVLLNENDILPLKQLHKKKLALVRMGTDTNDVFANTLNLYSQVDVFTLKSDFTEEDAAKTLSALKSYDPVIISIHKPDINPWKNQKISPGEIDFIQKAGAGHSIILDVFASPYSLSGLHRVNGLSAIVMSYQNNPYFTEMSAQIIFGGVGASGVLPVSVSVVLPAGTGIQTAGNIRFKYTIPEELGINRTNLNKVKEIAEEGIKLGAYPGCQVFAAKDGKVFYYEAFGNHTYNGGRPVQKTDIYDLASISKIVSTLAGVMRMYDVGDLDLKGKFGDYVPVVIGTNKENIKIEDILTHQAGLKAWIPFYTKTLDARKEWLGTIYSRKPIPGKTLQVADSMYILNTYRDTMFIKMFASTIETPGKYVYSDLSFYFMQAMVERWSGLPLDKFASRFIFEPLGATTAGYNPLTRFPKERIVPTEMDSLWRKQLVHGFVHDHGAAMMGGVAGHAGVFANANDLAKIMQMYLNKGTYGGERFLSEKTVEEFVKCRFCHNGNRRGLGFDRPDISGKGTPCDCVSYLSFGHTGFTGTMAWADPENGFLYIFLSNRVHPSAENKLLMSKDIRGRIQSVFYDALPK
jgi:beta-glucosidase-like glycosyl hydrolase/CubicO group peptidase (beta-lactamase class C family)